jgi:small subunit ribosomal protein S16
MGSKQAPFYRVVVSDGRVAPTGRFVDVLGFYNPNTDPAIVRLDVGKADRWIQRGAHPSDTVKRLIHRARTSAV